MKFKVKINWTKEPKTQTELNSVNAKPDNAFKDSQTLKLERVIEKKPEKKVSEKKVAIEKLKNEIKKKSSKSKLSIKELEASSSIPDGMSQYDFEEKISCERLSKLYLSLMAEKWQFEFSEHISPKERKLFKNYFRYFAKLDLAESLMKYVIQNWTGIKARYRLPYEYPMPGTFAYMTFIKQVAIEFHKKTHVTNVTPEYLSDFETSKDEPRYESDF